MGYSLSLSDSPALSILEALAAGNKGSFSTCGTRAWVLWGHEGPWICASYCLGDSLFLAGILPDLAARCSFSTGNAPSASLALVTQSSDTEFFPVLHTLCDLSSPLGVSFPWTGFELPVPGPCLLRDRLWSVAYESRSSSVLWGSSPYTQGGEGRIWKPLLRVMVRQGLPAILNDHS